MKPPHTLEDLQSAYTGHIILEVLYRAVAMFCLVVAVDCVTRYRIDLLLLMALGAQAFFYAVAWQRANRHAGQVALFNMQLRNFQPQHQKGPWG